MTPPASIWQSDLELQPPALLGMQLKPLQLGHPRVLKLAGSPLLEEARGAATAGDLAVAIWLCSLDASEGAAALRAARPAEFVRWAQALGPDADYGAALIAFHEYLSAFLRAPEFWEDPSAAKAAKGSPWWERVRFALVHYGHRDPDAVWNLRMDEALRWYAVAGEMLGGARIVSDEELAAEDSLPEARLVVPADGTAAKAKSQSLEAAP